MQNEHFVAFRGPQIPVLMGLSWVPEMANPKLGRVMRRRDFIAGIAGLAAAWPLAARAQQGRLPVVGILRPVPKETDQLPEPFRRYMRVIGWEDGRNVRFLFVWTEGQNERAPALAGELVDQKVAISLSHSATPPFARRSARLRPSRSSR